MLLKDLKRQLTRYEFSNHVLGLSEELKKFGIEEGDYVALQMDHGIDYVLAFFAIAHLGAAPVLIPTRLRNEQIQDLLRTYNIPLSLTKLPHYSATDSFTLRDPNTLVPGTHELILFTSGSSTAPKAAVLTFDNFIHNAIGSNKNISFNYGDKWLVNLPLYHVGGLSIFFRALVGGGCAYFSDLTDTNVTHVSMVYTQLYRFLQNPHQTYFKAILLGGSAFPSRILEAGVEAGLPLYRSYGMTEMASQITATEKNKLSTSGKILEGRELKIENGEIVVKGKTLFKGFLDQESVSTTDGWYPTRDLGFIDDHGRLTVTGRKDRMFVSGGENIQPESIEQVLINYPGILQSKVVPQENSEYGHVPIAYVDARIDADDLRGYLKQKLTGLQMPREILPYSTLPEHFKTTKDL